MKNIIKILIFILTFSFIQESSKYVQIFFITEGGSTNTSGFKIIDDYVNRTDGTYCATYSSNGTIKKLNTINGASFSISKSGTNLVSGREWYTYNYDNNKLYYFNQNNSYDVASILQKLSMTNDPYPVISLFAHWKGDGVDGGIDIGGSSNGSTNTVKAKSISLSGSSKITKGKSTTLKVTLKPSNAKKETITWSSSNKNVATVNSSGKVTGVSKGTVTITAKTSSGKTATFKVSVVDEELHKVNLSFNMNGGKLASSHANTLSSSGNNIIRVKDNSRIIQTITYGSKTSSSGLPNYNNSNFLNIEKDGYIAKKGAEWNTKPDGSGKSYNHNKVYKASDFCNAKNSDCNVTLYINWEKKKTHVYIKYNMNGGTLENRHGSNTRANGNKIICNGSEICQEVLKGKSLSKDGLFDYNNNYGINISRSGHFIIPDYEWNTKPDGSGKSFSQNKVYKASDFCNAKNSDCTVTLYANWRVNPVSSSFEITYYHGLKAQDLTDYQVRLIKEAGFTLIPLGANKGKVSSGDYKREMDKAIQKLSSNKIKVLVRDRAVRVNKNNYNDSDSVWNKKILSMVDYYSKYKYVVGYDVKDEPAANEFRALGKVNKRIMKLDPKRYAYINLFPNYAGDELLGVSGYDRYVNSFVSTVDPKVLSADHYTAFLKNKNVDKYKASYYDNLNQLRISSKKNNSIPMMIILLTEHGSYRYVSRNDLAFQVNTSLAFGMKTISYFTYSLWYDDMNAKNAMVDSNNNPTPHYYDVKSINSWLYPLGKQLYNKKVSKIYGFNEVKGLSEYNNSISFLGKIKSNNSGILSLYNDNSFLLVNSELNNKNTVFTFSDISVSSLQWFNPSTSNWENLKSGNFGTFSVNGNNISISQGYSVLIRKN